MDLYSLEIFGKRCFDPILDYISYWRMLQTRKLLKKLGNAEPYDMIILLFFKWIKDIISVKIE